MTDARHTSGTGEQRVTDIVTVITHDERGTVITTTISDATKGREVLYRNGCISRRQHDSSAKLEYGCWRIQDEEITSAEGCVRSRRECGTMNDAAQEEFIDIMFERAFGRIQALEYQLAELKKKVS